MSAFGLKRTCRLHSEMSAYDPKRPFGACQHRLFQCSLMPLRCLALSLWGSPMMLREFIGLLVTTAWPLLARAHHTAIPVIGFLSRLSVGDQAPITASFREGLNDAGYVEGRNVVVEYRWAEGQYDRL